MSFVFCTQNQNVNKQHKALKVILGQNTFSNKNKTPPIHINKHALRPSQIKTLHDEIDCEARNIEGRKAILT
jgi:hypothetical protein